MDVIEREPSIPEMPGLVILFGSGEISASGRRVYDWLFRRLLMPIQVAILETPAGFQPNSARVAERISEFMHHHLQNFHPKVTIVPARKLDTRYSPNDEAIISPIRQAGIIFLGPGSPTYTVRQLQNSLAWYTVLARHRQGATLVLASAATIAASSQALPVYEIYKAGEDLFWYPGLDLFGPYGLSLVFVSHWNNREGGAELDTSHCYIGQGRFEQLLNMLPSHTNIVGIDEHTALIIDTMTKSCHVMGRGKITLLRQREECCFGPKQTFDINELGTFHGVEPKSGIPLNIWEDVFTAQYGAEKLVNVQPPSEVISLLKIREEARARGDWEAADNLRKQIIVLGWRINDTRNGPRLIPPVSH